MVSILSVSFGFYFRRKNATIKWINNRNREECRIQTFFCHIKYGSYNALAYFKHLRESV